MLKAGQQIKLFKAESSHIFNISDEKDSTLLQATDPNL